MDVPIEKLDDSIYKVPTDAPESDGTYAWDSTTMVLVEAHAGGKTGMGYTYADAATGKLIEDKLGEVAKGRDPLDVQGIWVAMCQAVRNLGGPGISSMAISAVDNALWDLKARLLKLPLVKLLGQVRPGVPVYGSGGFTSCGLDRLCSQLRGWVESGIPRVKMKIGRHPEDDVTRVRAARRAIGLDAELFVDANGAYDRKQALTQAQAFAELGVRWFEEPVSSDDLTGLGLLRDRAPAIMDIAAGEYGYDVFYFRRMLQAKAVDVLQADATRCRSMKGFLRAAALCDAFAMPLSAHTAPAEHCHVCCAAPRVRNLEYFYDHARIEQIFFEGAASPREGILYPDLTRPGMGLELKRADAETYRLSS